MRRPRSSAWIEYWPFKPGVAGSNPVGAIIKMRRTKEALHWINNLLRKNRIKLIIFGGFAAKIYGSKRELADIDIAVQRKDIGKTYELVKKHAIRELKRYKDSDWNAIVVTINRFGQEIDIISIEDTKIFDKKEKTWKSFAPYFKHPVKRIFMGEKLIVISEAKLISYKKRLLRRADKKDIRYLTN